MTMGNRFMVNSVNPRFSGRSEVAWSLIQRRGEEEAEEARKLFDSVFKDDIAALPDSVVIRYTMPTHWEPEVEIELRSRVKHGRFFDHQVYRACDGWRFWREEPLEKTLGRAVERAKLLAKELKAV